ncbi:Structural maintenance of chromosomes protein 3 [Didymosphaeria variabile]|uniref:Structural maintenance of chromosomes protein n=1 Tax=Didymosphaeria variabile TaxID=1932322 RepID=A0A9W9C9K0_9PLEO|nr:Structural maintenance of chromosomes protein 3 [Didymosphaeria variabile]KAJ4352179.1 Structural maintenance of chromosomes protein 3 [Didymosphaeria variabile]
MGHIKHITIQGFKTYKNQVKTESFSPKSNVIVGRNGAGKTNFFSAVRFVLGDDYENMSKEERQALLHAQEGSGAPVQSAYVEVVFDNSDGRFHNSKDEFTLRRTIGLKKDEFSMDRKNATRREVNEMLEAAGLSRSNPFYIVPQGRVATLTNMKDEERLNMLKEISGSSVYEKRRADSLKLMNDTDRSCERIDGLVDDINTRLQELEGEKSELEAYNKNDRERRAILHTLNTRIEERLEADLNRIEARRHNGAADVDSQKAVFVQNELEMDQITDKTTELQSEIDLLTAERTRLEDDRRKASRQKAAIELELNDLTDGQSAAKQTQKQRDRELEQVRQDITARENELSELLPEYTTKKEEEDNVNSQLAEARGQQKRLFDKQGRGASYTSKRQRDDALRTEIDGITMQLATRKSVQMQTDDDIKELRVDIETLETEISDLEANLSNEGDNTIGHGEAVQKTKDAQQVLLDKQSNLNREQYRLQSQVQNASTQLRHAQSSLNHLLDHATSRGLETLQRLKERHNLTGIYGTVADLIQVPAPYKIATEIAAQASLFHVVCDTDETAAKCISLLNKEKGGRLTFMALNRVSPRNTQIPQTADAQPLLPKLRYDPRFEKAIKHVFGRVVVCPELSICQSLVRTHEGVLALTPDGDRAHRKGGYHGGYFDPSKSKIDAYNKAADLRSQVEELETRESEIRDELDSLRQQVTAAASEVRKAEYQKNHAEDSYIPMRQRLRAKQAELQQKKDRLERFQRNATQIAQDINNLASQQSDLEAELASDFKKALTRDEEEQLQSLGGTIRELNKQVAEITSQRSDLESRKAEIEVELRESLRPRLDQLLAQQSGSGNGGNQSTRLKEVQRQLKAVDRTITDLDRQIHELESSRDEASSQLTELEASRAEKEQVNRKIAKAIENHQGNLDKNMQKRAELKKQLDEVQRDLRDLGTLPEDIYRRYAKWSEDKLASELEKVNKALRKFKNVNKKAFQQYEDFTKRREQLIQRRGELNTSRESIENLIEVLDQRKDEAIARTFKQVSKYFSEVFVQLVPAGKGRLIIQRRSDREARRGEDDAEEDARRAKGASVENYTGVGIAVSFNSKHDEQQRIQQLSGGQKALCALALVFAIQQCDPAPFYLFDEIDANLDAQYRTAVAEMLRKLSGKGGESGEGGGQFICTTFRPEMVQVADKCYAVSFVNASSRIDVFDREGALDFVETSQRPGA